MSALLPVLALAASAVLAAAPPAEQPGPQASPPIFSTDRFEYLIHSMAFSPDGSLLAVAGEDSLKILDAATGEVLRTFAERFSEGDSDPEYTRTYAVLFSTDGKLLIGACDSRSGVKRHRIKVWDLLSQELVRTLDGHQGPIKGLSLSRDGSRLASASWDKTVRIWDTGAWKTVQTLKAGMSLSAVAMSRDGRSIAACGGGRPGDPAENRVWVWDAASGKPRKWVSRRPGGWMSSLAFSPNGRLLAVGGLARGLEVYDPASGAEVAYLGGFGDYQDFQRQGGARHGSGQVAFSPDGRVLAETGCPGGPDQVSPGDVLPPAATLRVFEVSTWSELYSVPGGAEHTAFVQEVRDARHQGASTSEHHHLLAFSPTLRIAAVGTNKFVSTHRWSYKPPPAPSRPAEKPAPQIPRLLR
ncbi:MAG: hypothetical protein PHU21_02045 [Elusimicrobia bacterium]|nr:hypothetical protein [Elusimicrobiota bacterium]